MAQRDYAARGGNSRKKKKSNGIGKTTILVVVGIVLIIFVGSLFFLKKNSPEAEKIVETLPIEPAPKSVLPSRPEEVWSYIQDLETREIPIDNSPSAIEKNAQLTAEQKKILAMLEQDKLAQQKKAEEAKKAAQARAEQQAATSKMETVEKPAPVVVEAKPEVKRAEPAKVIAKPATEQQKQAIVKEAEKKEPTKQVVSKPAPQQTANSGGFGLQCGAFKNKAQAENLQARLAMAGFNSRVASSADWNRVFVGPVGDRAAAAKAQANAKSITNCVIIGM